MRTNRLTFRLMTLGGLLPLATTACGDAINCALNGDNINGHVNFSSAAIPVQEGKSIVVQISNDGFGTVTQSARVSNLQGLISVPYSACGETGGVSLSIRAFQDDNGNGSWDLGEGAGRHDGTSDGNAAYITHSFPEPNPSVTPAVEWKQDRGVDIDIDGTAAQ